jgi:Zn-dependent metalloprotease
MFPKDNNLMAAPENEGPFGKRSFPPDADLRLNPENGTIQYLKGKNLSLELGGMSSASESPSDIALSFLELYKTLFKLQQPHDELRCVAAETDELGLKHVRFQQIHQAIPVWANELNVHLDQHNRVYLVQGRYIPTPQHVNTQPAISVCQAIEIAFESLGVKREDVAQDSAELVIYVKPPEKTLLAYKVYTPGWIYFVDAVKGDIIDRIATRQTVSDVVVPLSAKGIEKK